MSGIYRLTPIHQWHEDCGARFTEEAGWKCVDSYGDSDKESANMLASIGICDVTPLAKIDIQGSASESFLRRYVTSKLRPGFCLSSRVSAVPLPSIPLHVSRLKPDRFLLLSQPQCREVLTARLSDKGSALECIHVTDVTSAFAAIRLVGHKTPDLLKRLCPVDLGPQSFPAGRCLEAQFAKVRALLIHEDVSRVAAYYLLISRDYGEYIWKCLMAAGRECGIRPFGLTALRQLHREDTESVAVI